MKPLFRLFTLVLLLISPAHADIVKPALVEISVSTEGHYRVELRASIEALLTGINAQYKDTTQAPTAEEYDRFRVMSAAELRQAFQPFEQKLLDTVKIEIDGKPSRLKLGEVDIPPPGYTKVPRISLIVLEGPIDRSANHLTWYYPAAFGDNAVRVRQVDEQNEKWHWSSWQWIRDDTVSKPFSLQEVFTQPSTWQIFVDYVDAGFDHILPSGYDHILFILGLFLLSTQLRPLFWQITMFTLAHSITLGMTIYGLIDLPARIVEPLIALSIAYIGIENIWHKKLHNSRLLVVFAFGLLHGMGFAGFLSEFGMPDDAFFIALLGFNVGVELGQITLLIMAFAVVGYWLGNKSYYRRVFVLPSSVIITVIGLYWTWERISL